MAACLNYIDRLMLTTMRGSIMEEISMTEAQFGLLTSIFLVVYAICSPLAGFLADRFNRSNVITISLLAWSIVTLLTAYAQTYEQLLAARALLGLTEAACMPASVALIVDYHRGNTRSLASGLLLSGAMIGGAMAGLGGWIAEGNGWAHAYKIFGLIGIGHAILLWALLRDPPACEKPVEAESVRVKSASFGDALSNLFTNRSYLILLFYACVLGMVSWSVVGWMPTYIMERFDLSQGEAGLSTTIYLNISALIGMLVGGAWADRWSRTNAQARFLVPVIGLLVAAPSVLLIANASILPLALAGLVGYGLSRHFSDANMMPILCVVVDERYRATSWGISTFFSCVVGGAGIYAGGLLRDAQVDISRVLQFAAINLVISAAILYYLRRCRSANAAG